MFKLWPWLEANKNRLIGLAVAIVVVAGILYFISEQSQQKEMDAGNALTALMLNPGGSGAQLAASLEQVADKYAGTMAGQRARVQAASALFETGNYADAEAQFEKYLQDHSSGPFAATAELGVASSLLAQNKLDAAGAAFQRVISLYASSTCVGEADLGLAEIAVQQKKYSEAASDFEQAARASMGTSLAQEAMMREADLKTKIAAAAPKAEAQPVPTAFKPSSLVPAITPPLTNHP